MKEQHVHTWHGGLYCGSVPVEYLINMGMDDEKNFFDKVDPNGYLFAHGEYHYLDFEGVAVTLKLEDYAEGDKTYANQQNPRASGLQKRAHRARRATT